MHRIDVPSATPEHKFTEGSPTGGVPATVVSADWLNDLQENVMSVLEDADIAPVKGLATQLRDAIRTIAGTIAQATEAVLGGAKVATQVETDAGVSDAVIVTPKKMRWGVTYSFGSNSYIILPTWLGSFCMQFGSSAPIVSGGNGTTNFPIAFPNTVLAAFISYPNVAGDVAVGSVYVGQIRSLLTTQILIRNLGPSTAQYYWLALGR